MNMYRYVLQVQMLVVHRVTQLPDLLLHLGDLPVAQLGGGVYHNHTPLVLVQLQQPDHQVQARPVQVHVQPVSAEDVHQRGRTQSQVLHTGRHAVGMLILVLRRRSGASTREEPITV